MRFVLKYGGFGVLSGLLVMAALALVYANVAGYAATMESAQGSIYLSGHFCF